MLLLHLFFFFFFFCVPSRQIYEKQINQTAGTFWPLPGNEWTESEKHAQTRLKRRFSSSRMGGCRDVSEGRLRATPVRATFSTSQTNFDEVSGGNSSRRPETINEVTNPLTEQVEPFTLKKKGRGMRPFSSISSGQWTQSQRRPSTTKRVALRHWCQGCHQRKKKSIRIIRPKTWIFIQI